MKIESLVSELQYPIGKFSAKENYTREETLQSIDKLDALSDHYIQVSTFLKNKLDITYRQDGWSAIQVINHTADVYMNAFLRTKWLLTEKGPVIKPYDEAEFSKLDDGVYNDIDSTLVFIKNVVKRWVILLRSLPVDRFDLSIYHPENGVTYSLHKLIAMYTWHGYHHLAHLEIIKNKN